jgi:hypothetical protein
VKPLFTNVCVRFLLILAAVGLPGCTTVHRPKKAEEKAITDQSWFRTRPGVDRFYLAYSEFSEKFPGSDDLQGRENLLGVACYGEDPNPEAPVKNPATGKLMPASSRERLQDFAVVKDQGGYPGAGNCIVILGQPKENARWEIKVNDDQVAELKSTLIGTGAACLGLGGAVLTASLAVQSAAVTAAPTAGASVGALAAISGPVWISLATSAALCANGFGNSKLAVDKYRVNDSNRVLLESLAKAEELAKDALMENNGKESSNRRSLREIEALLSMAQGKRDSEKIRHAAAIFNPYYVRAFNRDLDAKMEQGWGKGERFFEAIRSLQIKENDFFNPAGRARG